MRLHYLQHVWFEDLGIIKEWAELKGFKISSTAFFDNEKLPEIDDIDWLVIMGGPMNVHEEEKYPWLEAEKKFIKDAISRGKKVIGVCLGAQLIANVLGAEVVKNEFKEIGWFPVQKTDVVLPEIFDDLPAQAMVFHWHGDTFNIPDGAVRVLESSACENQAFTFNKGKVIGLQFHMEVTNDGIVRIIEQCSDDITLGKYVHAKPELINDMHNLNNANLIMFRLLDNLAKL